MRTYVTAESLFVCVCGGGARLTALKPSKLGYIVRDNQTRQRARAWHTPSKRKAVSYFDVAFERKV